jgi:hypothetical protein
MTTLASSNFEDMWSLNYPHLNVKKHQENLVEWKCLLRNEHFEFSKKSDDYYYTLELGLL